MINITNLTTQSIDENFLKKVPEKVLEQENKKGQDLSIVLVGPERMRKLNKRYRGKNRVTDVLAFGSTEEGELGEVVICLSEIKKNAKRFNSTFEKELILCLIHGILHLLGYDHEISKEKEKEMEEKQQYYISQFIK